MSPAQSTFLISGAAGDIGQSLAAILRRAYPRTRIIGADIREPEPHPLFALRLQLPRADHAGYLDALTALLTEHHVDVLIPGSEAELAVLLDAGWIGGFRAPVHLISANAQAISIGLDKLATNQALVAAGLPAPWTMSVKEGAPPAIPCIFKQRKGQGSKGLQILRTLPDAALIAAHPHHIFQQLMPDDEAEFTCGLYRTAQGETRTVILRRKLKGGLTGEAVVEHHAGIEALLHRIADALDLKGSINVQLRLLEDVPMVFEINPRFSSTVGFRDEIGFADLIWSIEETFGMPLAPFVPTPTGLRYLRG